MRVTYISGHDAVGQRFNGLTLHRALLADGHTSAFLVAEQSLREPGIHHIGSPWLRRANSLAVKLERQLSRQSDLALLGRAGVRHPAVRSAEIVHLQLLHAKSFFSLRHLPRLTAGSRSVVWTLHDPWITTGHCVHSLGCNRWQTGCGACPDLTLSLPIKRDRTAANWALKQRLLARSRIHLVVASRWMARRVAASPILAGLPCTRIPFGIDTSVFQPSPKPTARLALGIAPDARVVAVRWAPNYLLKGSRFAEEALLRLPAGTLTDIICFDTAGGDEVAALRRRYRVTTINSFNDPAAIANGLAAADLFLMPSLAETFGMMAIEAMACGTPPIVFTGTALPEVIDAPRSGIAVEAESAAALSQAISTLMHHDEARQRCREEGLALVRSRYEEQRYIADHLALYRQLCQA